MAKDGTTPAHLNGTLPGIADAASADAEAPSSPATSAPAREKANRNTDPLAFYGATPVGIDEIDEINGALAGEDSARIVVDRITDAGGKEPCGTWAVESFEFNRFVKTFGAGRYRCTWRVGREGPQRKRAWFELSAKAAATFGYGQDEPAAPRYTAPPQPTYTPQAPTAPPPATTGALPEWFLQMMMADRKMQSDQLIAQQQQTAKMMELMFQKQIEAPKAETSSVGQLEVLLKLADKINGRSSEDGDAMAAITRGVVEALSSKLTTPSAPARAPMRFKKLSSPRVGTTTPALPGGASPTPTPRASDPSAAGSPASSSTRTGTPAPVPLGTVPLANVAPAVEVPPMPSDAPEWAKNPKLPLLVLLVRSSEGKADRDPQALAGVIADTLDEGTLGELLDTPPGTLAETLLNRFPELKANSAMFLQLAEEELRAMFPDDAADDESGDESNDTNEPDAAATEEEAP